MKIKLTLKDKKLMKNKKVREWLKVCEKKISERAENAWRDLIFYGEARL
jgi:hypothetical protein